jgi:hypothetical protein
MIFIREGSVTSHHGNPGVVGTLSLRLSLQNQISFVNAKTLSCLFSLTCALTNCAETTKLSLSAAPEDRSQ